MANKITLANIKPISLIGKTSRYINQNVIYWGDNKILTFNTYKRTSFPFADGDKFTILTKTQEFRPDLVSLDFYGIPNFWWSVMEANGIKDILDFRAGLNIRLPSSIF